MIRITGLDHVVLRVRDVARMVRFYSDVLGCTLEREVADLGLVQLRVWNGIIDTFGGSEFPPGLARCRVARRRICPACPSSSLLTAGRFRRDQTHR
jgi:catechol 2,3-dioxygenase-like lactoylglutathione lyase family enzyme